MSRLNRNCGPFRGRAGGSRWRSPCRSCRWWLVSAAVAPSRSSRPPRPKAVEMKTSVQAIILIDALGPLTGPGAHDRGVGILVPTTSLTHDADIWGGTHWALSVPAARYGTASHGLLYLWGPTWALYGPGSVQTDSQIRTAGIPQLYGPQEGPVSRTTHLPRPATFAVHPQSSC